MNALRLKYSLFHEGFQSHSTWSPSGPREVERALKYMALYYESVLIADSDLNNQSIMQELLPSSRRVGFFQEAIACGFVRRAVRARPDGAPKPQLELFEDYKKNNAARASKIPDTHPRRLDQLFERAEREHVRGLYEVKKLAEVFADRIVFNLDALLHDNALSPGARAYANMVLGHVADLKERGEVDKLRGATIEERFAPANKTQDPDWKTVWEPILMAYTGNLPEAFGGELIGANPVPMDANPIPAGPEAPAHAKEISLGHFMSIRGGRDRSVETRVETVPLGIARWKVKREDLFRLRIQEIMELRERAGGQEFFDLRHRFLGGADATPEQATRLTAALDDYLERVNRVRNEVARHQELRRAVLGVCKRARLVGASEEETMISCFIPGRGEYNTLFRTDELPAGRGRMDRCTLRRPDYGLFHRRADLVLGG